MPCKQCFAGAVQGEGLCRLACNPAQRGSICWRLLPGLSKGASCPAMGWWSHVTIKACLSPEIARLQTQTIMADN